MELMHTSDSDKRPSLFDIYLTFAVIGLMMFGGGYSMLPILEREIITKRQWSSIEEMSDYYAIGQCTPGIIAVNTATFIGKKQRGVVGAIAATLGIVTPSIIIISALARVISIVTDNIYVEKAFMGIRVCVVILIISAIAKLWKNAVIDKATGVVFAAVFIASIVTDISPVIVVIILVCIGIIVEKIKGRRQK